MENIENKFWSISLYIDKDNNLIGIPCGKSEKYTVSDIDTVLTLKAPYEQNRVESFIEEVVNACYTKEHNDNFDYSTIEKYTKIKGFVEATRKYTLITIIKTQDNYSIMPTFNDYEKGPIVIDDDEVILPKDYVKGELAKVIFGMIDIYGKANFAQLEDDE